MFGENGRIGMIVPANNATLEPEIWPQMPEGAALYATRILAKGNLTPGAVKAMELNVDRAVDELTATIVDVIAYADMVTTFIMDPDWNDRRAAEMSAHAGVPVYTCWTAMRAALEYLSARSFALATPYPAPIHAGCRPYFEERGYRVTGDATLDILAMTDVPKVKKEAVLDCVKRIDKSGADAIVILATDLPTFAAIPEIEKATGLPVLTSNQTLLWQGLRLCNKSGAKATGPGRLFDA